MNLSEYKTSGRTLYVAFASAVAAILRAALSKSGDLNVQVVVDRAKDVASLEKKLIDRGLLETESLEAEIKDLAGCRIVLYTNSDSARLGQSRIIRDNFDVLEVKIHEPGVSIGDTNELYQSSHFIVSLKENRASLPEYSEFTGLRCEVQVQTILNHSWAAMAHDTIYKAPAVKGFGRQALDAVRARLSRVMTKYLLPAGYEFDKIRADFERLAAGKQLFDGQALAAIGASTNNNERAEAIDTFVEQVMPLYDDLRAEFRSIVDELVAAVKAARVTEPVPRTAYFGTLPAITSSAIARSVAIVLTNYRYVDIVVTFNALCDLYASATDIDERDVLKKAAEQLAKHHMQAWKAVGPEVQSELVRRIEALQPELAVAISPLLTVMLKEVLGAEISGTTNDSSIVTFHTGAVRLDDELLQTRHRATAILEGLFKSTKVESEQRAILAAMAEATQATHSVPYGNDLAAENARAAAALLNFEREHAGSISNLLLESLEDRARRFFRTYTDMPKAFVEDDKVAAAGAEVVSAALKFRDTLNANADFVKFKTLVGFEAVFPPAWESEAFQWREAEEYRQAQIEGYVATITPADSEPWFERIERYASTESRDLATFPSFGLFLVRLGQTHPAMALDYLGKMGAGLANFAHCLIDGAMMSGDPAAAAFVRHWIAEGKHLGSVARYLVHANPFDPTLLASVCQRAIELGDAATLKVVVAAAERQFREGKVDLDGSSFLQALHYFFGSDDLRWVDQFVPWLDSPIIKALPEDEARAMLKAMVRYPDIQNNAEYLVAGVATNWPGAVLDFFSDRLAFSQQPRDEPDDDENSGADDGYEHYSAFPFALYQLGTPLRDKPGELIDAARAWYGQRPELFRFGGAHIVATVFKGADDALSMELERHANTGDEADAKFVLAILVSLRGREPVFSLTKELVAQFAADSEVHHVAEDALRSAGVLHGEFGTAEMFEERKLKVAEWLDDPRPVVAQFALEFVRHIEADIASERRRARARIAQRRLDHGEDPHVINGPEE